MAQAISFQTPAVIESVRYWLLHENDGKCQSAVDASLWFVSLMAAAVLWSYVLGANDIRRWIHRNVGAFSDSWDPEIRAGASIFGSLALQLLMTLATSSILKHSSQTSDSQYQGLLYPFAAWYIRPLPATAIFLSSTISPRSYFHNTAYVSLVELLYSLGSIPFYIALHSRSSAALRTSKSAITSQPPKSTPSRIQSTSTSSRITSVTSTSSSEPTSTTISKDRTCGGQNKYSCKGTSWGSCCSEYGYCGSDSSYCGTGCQLLFGDCSSNTPKRSISSPDGTCGGANGYTCLNSTHGLCCSSSHFCGETINYCGLGCQPNFGSCTSSVSPVGTQGLTPSLKILQAGSSAGIAYSVIVFLVVITAVCTYASHRVGNLPFSPSFRKLALKVAVAICILLNMWRLTTSFTLLNAALQLGPDVFCPSSITMSKITALWVFVPGIDHFWRALF